jgi:hypothetical protein
MRNQLLFDDGSSYWCGMCCLCNEMRVNKMRVLITKTFSRLRTGVIVVL